MNPQSGLDRFAHFVLLSRIWLSVSQTSRVCPLGVPVLLWPPPRCVFEGWGLGKSGYLENAMASTRREGSARVQIGVFIRDVALDAAQADGQDAESGRWWVLLPSTPWCHIRRATTPEMPRCGRRISS